MGLRINTNVPSLAAQRGLSESQRKLDTTMRQLATGNRFADLSEGPGDYAIAETLKAHVRGQGAGRNNAENAISYVQVAEGGLNEQNNLLIRMRELSIQSASDTFSDTERELMDMEFQQLLSEFDRIAQTTRFGSSRLLAGENKTMEFQVGSFGTANDIIKFSSNADTTVKSMDLNGLEVGDKSDARESLEYIDEAITGIAKTRAHFGAIQSRLESASANASVQIENLEAARSRIADTDFAKAASELFKQQALSQYQISILSQANQFPTSVLRLLG